MHDVAIVGAGLAGAALAHHLAVGGARVLLLEALRYPTHKLCGEFLSPEAQGLCRRLGLSLAAAGAVPIRRVVMTGVGGARWAAPLPGEALGLSRRALDPLLFDVACAAGADGEQEAEARDIAGRAGHFTVRYHRRGAELKAAARLVVLAHGKRGRLDHALGRRFVQEAQPYVAFKTHYAGLGLGDTIEVHGFSGGYLGLSAVEGGRVNACLLARAAVLREAGRSYGALLAHMGAGNAALAARLRGAEPLLPRPLAVGQVAFGRKELAVREVLTVGDAAALIAPLCGDGMAMALRGAELLAPLLLEHLGAGGAFAALAAAYQRRFDAEFRRRLALGRLLQAGLLRPGVTALGLRALCGAPALGAWLIRATRGAQVT